MSTSASVPGGPGMWPRSGINPNDGFSPKTPQKFAGWRTEPAMSLPSSRPVKPAASAAAEPPDEPPGVSSGFHGLRVTPWM